MNNANYYQIKYFHIRQSLIKIALNYENVANVHLIIMQCMAIFREQSVNIIFETLVK